MKRFLLVLTLILLLSTMSLTGANLQEVIPVDSPVYTQVRALYLEVGYAPPSLSIPWSVAELNDILSYIPQNRLNNKGLDLFSQVSTLYKAPDMETKTFRGKIGFEPALEMYLHKNDTHYQQETDWIYNYTYRKPLISIPIEIFLTDYIYNKTDFAIMKTRNSFNDNSSVTDSSEIYSPQFTLNHPFSEGFVNHLDLNFPERAVVGLGIGRLNLVLGRDDLNWGTGKTGSLTIGDHLDYYDFIRFSTFHEKFKYTYLIAGFDSPSWISADQNSTNSSTLDDSLKMYIAHRLEFRMFSNRVSFALTEGMIYQTSTLDFRYFNPAMLYHNLFIRGNANSTLTFELSINPYKYLHVYGNIILDEFPFPGEDQTDPAAHPNGIGQQYGFEGMYPMGKGYLSAYVEFVHTDPYLYLRDNVDYIVNRRIFNMENGFTVKRNFLGYKYGNDTIVASTGIEYWIAQLFSTSLSATYMWHGESNMDTVWGTGPAHVNKKTPYDDPATPTKTVEKSLIISTKVEAYPFYSFESKHLHNLGVMTQLDYIQHWNKGNDVGLNTNDIQWTFGINWKL